MIAPVAAPAVTAGTKVGILGAGQLGRMLALAGQSLNITTHCYDPADDACAAQVTRHTKAPWDDQAQLTAFAASVDVVTWEFENVPLDTAVFLSRIARIFPNVTSLATGQNRALEKNLATLLGADVHPFAFAHHPDELNEAISRIGVPCVIKTLRGGYDGKGQLVLRAPDNSQAHSQAHFQAHSQARSHAAALCPCIVEKFVPFDAEVSVVGVRSRDGAMATYPPTRNIHRDGILRYSSPIVATANPLAGQPLPLAPIPAAALARADAFVRRLLDHLGYVGALAVEFFVLGDALLFNELAPRVHNSGHWTIEGACTSQFENHLRAITGLPLGDCSCRNNESSVMLNIVSNPADTAAICGIAGAHLHDYGKQPREGRKLGHVTLHPIPHGWATAPSLSTLIPKL